MVNLPTQCEVECDGCGESQSFELTEYGGDPTTVGLDDATLEDEGWVRRSGDVLCPECAEEEEE